MIEIRIEPTYDLGFRALVLFSQPDTFAGIEVRGASVHACLLALARELDNRRIERAAGR